MFKLEKLYYDISSNDGKKVIKGSVTTPTGLTINFSDHLTNWGLNSHGAYVKWNENAKNELLMSIDNDHKDKEWCDELISFLQDELPNTYEELVNID